MKQRLVHYLCSSVMYASDIELQSFNAVLVISELELGIREYLLRRNAKLALELVHPCMDELVSPPHASGPHIPHEKLVPFGILSANCPESECAALMKLHGFEYGEDYRIVPSPCRSCVRGASRASYHLSQRAFEICLMRAAHTSRYASFYSMLNRGLMEYASYRMAFAKARASECVKLHTEAEVPANIVAAVPPENKVTDCDPSTTDAILRQVENLRRAINIPHGYDNILSAHGAELKQHTESLQILANICTDLASTIGSQNQRIAILEKNTTRLEGALQGANNCLTRLTSKVYQDAD